MSVRVVARIRPLLKSELDKDSIVEPGSAPGASQPTLVRIPNPKNAAESYSFNFNSVYDQTASQQDVFDNEISPTVKHLFSGFDVTIFAYGVTGTGKTHTMRGGKSLADRGVIPRLLSAVFRRGRKIEKDSAARKRVDVSMSYYEIYNDKVYDLFEPVEKRSATGLPIRDNNGKSVVCGLSERPCTTLKEFESAYDQANVNRSTAGTKLNAHSSRSHAILCVKVTQISDDGSTVISTASAIDLAGSEDNRRTDNGKERLVESSAINRSLFVLAQCVEAISKRQNRIPYRESKMTRILSLGQNNGLTVMILNLAPVRSYHLDTLSSLNFANRTKKIEVREVENEPIFKTSTKPLGKALAAANVQRQPLRPLPSAGNVNFSAMSTTDKPVRSFPVFSEKNRRSSKRPSDGTTTSIRPPKAARHSNDTTTVSIAKRPLPHMPKSAASTTSSASTAAAAAAAGMTKSQIEDLVNRMVDERLAARTQPATPTTTAPPLSADVQRRLEALEHRITAHDDSRAEGLQFLLMAKQFTAHGELASALRMYRLALPFFPENEKLASKMLALQRRLAEDSRRLTLDDSAHGDDDNGDDGAYTYADSDDDDAGADDEFETSAPARKARRRTRLTVHADAETALPGGMPRGALTPRTAHVLRILNSRDLSQIRSLRGVGAKRAAAIVDALVEMDCEDITMSGLDDLASRSGVGFRGRGLDVMREGVVL